MPKSLQRRGLKSQNRPTPEAHYLQIHKSQGKAVVKALLKPTPNNRLKFIYLLTSKEAEAFNS